MERRNIDRTATLWEPACWLLLTFHCHLPTSVVNQIVQHWCLQQGRTLLDFFASEPQEWSRLCHLNDKTIQKICQIRSNVAHSRAPNQWPMLLEQVAFIQQLEYDAVFFLTVLDGRYPQHLKQALGKRTPPILFYSGDLGLLEHATIAITGSRNAQIQSLAFTREAARELARQGANVISGYTRGIDKAAYEGTGLTYGYTTVVLPHGCNRLSNAQLYQLLPRIAAGKALLLSQFHPTVPWSISRAMERNKVVTGLAEVVIVAESHTSGGTWNGAVGALAQQRPVYAYQSSQLPAGNSALLSQGARPLYWAPEQTVLPTYKHTMVAASIQESSIQQQELAAQHISHNPPLSETALPNCYQTYSDTEETFQEQISRLLRETSGANA